MLSPAKINIGLSVPGKRPDGFHYLHSIFAPISFGDEIAFEFAPAGSGVSDHEIRTVNELEEPARSDFERVSERGDISRNLLYRTLRSFTDGLKAPIRVRLIKRVPTGAGLGGGSSNAGMLLRFLRDQAGIDPERIKRKAAELGSDIPFFLQSGPMLVGGRGEIMEPIELGPGRGVVCCPEIRVPTGAAYADLKRPLQRDLPSKSWTVLNGAVREALRNSDWGSLSELKNDFEEVVFAGRPELVALKNALLENGGVFASLSGSGSAVYALTPDQSTQGHLFEKIKELYPNLNRHRFEFTHMSD